ncbi:MAG: ArsR family transcriptional regulator [Candidatus Dormibacteria bacterium]
MTPVGRAPADPTGCRVLRALLVGPAYPSDLARRMLLTRANASNHLACLRGCGPVLAEPMGRQVNSQLADRTPVEVFWGLTDALHTALLAVATDALDSRGTGVARRSGR